MENREVIIGGIYRHFKGNIYKVLMIGYDTEDESKKVIYQGIDNEKVWIRDYNMFLSPVVKNKYPDILNEFRFELVE